jgi:hypothetical protein
MKKTITLILLTSVLLLALSACREKPDTTDYYPPDNYTYTLTNVESWNGVSYFDIFRPLADPDSYTLPTEGVLIIYDHDTIAAFDPADADAEYPIPIFNAEIMVEFKKDRVIFWSKYRMRDEFDLDGNHVYVFVEDAWFFEGGYAYDENDRLIVLITKKSLDNLPLSVGQTLIFERSETVYE